jgi:hypothetical protein
MTEPNNYPPVPAEAAGAVAPPPTTVEAADAAPPASSADSSAASGVAAAAEAAPDANGDLPTAPNAAPARPFWRAFGHALVHLLAMGSLLFVLVGLAPRVERICVQMQYDERTALTNLVFDAGYFVKKNWFLAPLLLLFDLAVLGILRRSGDEGLARNYTTIVVTITLLLSIVLGYGLISPLGDLLKLLK